tara:strand:- start:1840 stop:2508 length:669 start_codon:yes stop_codon:yes gene_type:complete
MIDKKMELTESKEAQSYIQKRSNDFEIITNNDKIPYLLAKNYFTKKEMDLILSELRFLTPKMTFQDGKNLPTKDYKKNTQIGLDDLYTDRTTSNILSLMNKIYGDVELLKKLNDLHWFYTTWRYTNLDNTFVAYYENTDYYKAHRDIAVISIMYWIWEEPKSFTGGDIYLSDYDIDIPLERNQLLIIPSSTNHAVQPIKMNDDIKKLSGMGRYCIARFLKLQ